MAISRCFLHFQQLYHDIFQLNIPYCVDIINNKCINYLVWALIIRNVLKISQKTPGSLNVRLSTRITRLPIVAMNDYRHFATGPYSRGGVGVLNSHHTTENASLMLKTMKSVDLCTWDFWLYIYIHLNNTNVYISAIWHNRCVNITGGECEKRKLKIVTYKYYMIVIHCVERGITFCYGQYQVMFLVVLHHFVYCWVTFNCCNFSYRYVMILDMTVYLTCSQ